MASKPVKVLIVDDSPALRRALCVGLAAGGWIIHEAQDGEEALAILREHPIDLVLLDIDMPGMSGLEACRRMRQITPHPGIVMVTVCDSLDEKVLALEAGADDYVTKPFLLRELLARLRALLRRVAAEPAASDAIFRAGDLELDTNHRTLHKSGREIRLSPTEFNLLAYLMQHAGIPLDRARLLRSVWGAEYGSELEYLRTYVRLLRKKIETDPAHPQYLLTEPWIGYRFCASPDPESAEASRSTGVPPSVQ